MIADKYNEVYKREDPRDEKKEVAQRGHLQFHDEKLQSKTKQKGNDASIANEYTNVKTVNTRK